YHQAALASVPRSLEDPLATHAACATGTLTVLHAARLAGVRRVVYAGSSSAYGDQPGDDKNETQPPAVLSPYGAAKLAGESYCQAFWASYGFETVVLRYFNVFGPRQDPHSPYSAVIPKFLDLMRQGLRPTIFGDGSQSRDFTYVSNVVDANLLAADAPGVSGQVFNIANGDSTDLVTLVARLNELLGTSIAPEFAPARAGDVKLSRADISKARAGLKYAPRIDFNEGLKKLVLG
ncbi:MAG TPA: NAD-dependent epimerase/dehydratase family protein, partial [Pirellulales bacterium]